MIILKSIRIPFLKFFSPNCFLIEIEMLKIAMLSSCLDLL